ncbi:MULTISPECIES: MarR family winged helix-turn-helix transcriptional regulator [Actinoalloteichus]|nr:MULTISPECIES: MarR family transcriptional regulator [Actinoalloteichus]
MAAERQPPGSPSEGAYPVETRATDVAAESLTLLLGRAGDTVRPKVSPAQLRALQVVEWHHSINLTGLAEVLGAMPSSASRLCDRLEAAGLLERRSGALDRREIELVLSPDGVRLLSRLRETRRADLGAVLSTMSRQGRTALLRGLHEFAAAFDRRESAEGRRDGSIEPPPDGGGRYPEHTRNSETTQDSGTTQDSETARPSRRPDGGSEASDPQAPKAGAADRRERLDRDRGLVEQWDRGSSGPRGRRRQDGPGPPRDGSIGARPDAARPDTEQSA